MQVPDNYFLGGFFVRLEREGVAQHPGSAPKLGGYLHMTSKIYHEKAFSNGIVAYSDTLECICKSIRPSVLIVPHIYIHMYIYII